MIFEKKKKWFSFLSSSNFERKTFPLPGQDVNDGKLNGLREQ